MSKRALVDEQPRLRHAHGNYAYRRHCSRHTLTQSRSDLRLAIVEGSPFRVPVDEEQIAWIEFDAPLNAAYKRSWGISQPSQISKWWLDGQRTAKAPQQPR